MTGVGTSRSIPSAIDQRPSPESETWPLMFSRSLPSAAKAPAGELEQPRAHDRAPHPEVGHLLELDREPRLVHQLEALRVGLHDPVLDAVVDHLHEVPGARVAEVAPAVRRGEHVEDRGEPVDRLLVAADHHAVADVEPPDAAGRPDVDVVDPALVQGGGAAHVVVPLRVAAVDDRVARLQQRRERVDRLLGRVARGDHEPDRARRVEGGDEVLERVHAGRAVGLRGAHRLLVVVERHHLVVRVAVDAMDHVAAHLAEADEAELHAHASPSTRDSTVRARSAIASPVKPKCS